MGTSRPGRVVCVLAAASLSVATAAGIHALDHDLRRRAASLDLQSMLRAAHLPGRVSRLEWGRARFVLLPRPGLVLENVAADLLSGRPGPGAASGSIRLDGVRLVPGLDYLLHGRVDRIEATGGTLEIGEDLLPKLPAFYVDPIDGAHRPLPWSALLAVAGDSLASGRTAPEAGVRRPRAARGDVPSVSVRRLRVRLALPEAFPGSEFVLDRARLDLAGNRLALAGDMRVREGGRAYSIPIRFDRSAGERGAAAWHASAGHPGAGFGFEGAPGPNGVSSWSVRLDDPHGLLAGALIAGRGGLFSRLTLEGGWRLEAGGSGSFPAGMKETRIELLGGRLSMATDAGRSELSARGRLKVVPGRVELPGLTLRSMADPADSARLRFEWIKTLNGRRVRGALDGRLDPAWLAVVDPEWSARGSINCALGFEGWREGSAGAWTLLPRSRIEGTLRTLAGPWFADTLRDAKVEVWTERGRLHSVLFGRWGDSPFRLAAEGMPQPSHEYLAGTASTVQWSFRASYCRLEDFALAPVHGGAGRATPFWLGLPGRGVVEIGHGSVAGIPFDTLRSVVVRNGSDVRLDSLVVRIAGGVLQAAPRNFEPAASGDPGLVLAGEGLDLSLVQEILRRKGLLQAGDLRGRLSGTVRVAWGAGEEHGGPEFEGSIRIVDGRVHGLPLQQSLCGLTRAETFSTIAFRESRMDVRYGSGVLGWTRMRVDAPPFRLEGAGRLAPDRSLDAALLVRPLPGGAPDPVAGGLLSMMGEKDGALYTVASGSADAPLLRIVSRSEFLKKLELLGGTLPLGGVQ